MQLDAAVFIGCIAGSIHGDFAAGPGIVYTQFHVQSVDYLLPPSVMQGDAMQTIGVVNPISANGRVICRIVGNTLKSRDAVAKDRYLFTCKHRRFRCLCCRCAHGDNTDQQGQAKQHGENLCVFFHFYRLLDRLYDLRSIARIIISITSNFCQFNPIFRTRPKKFCPFFKVECRRTGTIQICTKK